MKEKNVKKNDVLTIPVDEELAQALVKLNEVFDLVHEASDRIGAEVCEKYSVENGMLCTSFSNIEKVIKTLIADKYCLDVENFLDSRNKCAK